MGEIPPTMVSSSRSLVALVTSLSLLAGCYSYNYTAIKPTELPKLNGATYGQVVDGPGRGQAVAVSVHQVETPEGRLVEINGTFDVVIDTAQGEWTFEHPIGAAVEDDTLLVKSSNQSPARIPLSQINSVVIKQPDSSTNGILGAFLTLVIAGAVGLLVVAATT